MLAKYLWEIGSIIFALMGSMHLRGTFYKNKLFPRDEKLVEEMKIAGTILSEKLNMWKGWISFNATHSSGVIFIGVINFYLAANYFSVIQSDHFFFLFNIATIGFYVWVAKKYWFNILFVALSIVWACFIVSYILTMINA
jgi:hypothetical protein